MPAFEANFDGLGGPTHNYAGLSWGNLASQKHALTVSSPRQAALQGLAKMKFLADLGVNQGILPPHPRPDLHALRQLGFSGSDADVLYKARKDAPRLLAACYSASSMWAANAATVSPSGDSADRRVHFTAANLRSQFHRSIEAPFTANILKLIFNDDAHFAHHDPLPATDLLGDEGAANHTRLCPHPGDPGIELFVYGRTMLEESKSPARFPARQTREASEAIARLHYLHPATVLMLQQNSAVIDAGAFHNDVVAVGNENVLLFHASAYEAEAVATISQTYRDHFSSPLYLISASEGEIPLADAISTYIFNSQLVTMPDGSMSLIAPEDCREHPQVQAFIQRILSEQNPVQSVHYLDVRQSMQNGGGPACLRLRVVLTEEEWARVHPGVVISTSPGTPGEGRGEGDLRIPEDLGVQNHPHPLPAYRERGLSLYDRLAAFIERRYRETLHPDDLADPLLLLESRDALQEVGQILNLATVYS
jgi:succinylarginine dihydrolase